MFKVKLIPSANKDLVFPTRAYQDDAGIDVMSNEHVEIEPWTRKVVGTGISIEFEPKNPRSEYRYYIRVAPRSGLSVKNNIDIGAGVIDQKYRGEVKVVVINNSDNAFIIKPGDKIAQLIITMCIIPEIVLVDEIGIDDTSNDRQDRGFGSSG